MSKLTPQHKLLLCILAAVILNAAIWFLGVDPAREAIAETEKKLSVQNELETELRQRLAVLEQIDTDALETELEEMQVLIPDEGLLREVMIELEAVAAEKGILLSSMSITEPGLEQEYQNLKITLAVQGEYQNLFDYISYLENNPRLLLVNSFSFGGASDEISSSVNLTVFSGNFDPYTPHEAPGRDNPFEAD